jgi:hypothetical protein
MMLLVVSNAFAIKPGEDKNPNGFTSGAYYKMNIHGKIEGFKCPETYFGSNIENNQGNSGVCVQGYNLATRAIRVTKGGSPVIILQVGNDTIYYHNYFRIVMKN